MWIIFHVLAGIGYGDVSRIVLAQDGHKWRAHVNVVKNLQYS
jgi:hypothetical protein